LLITGERREHLQMIAGWYFRTFPCMFLLSYCLNFNSGKFFRFLKKINSLHGHILEYTELNVLFPQRVFPDYNILLRGANFRTDPIQIVVERKPGVAQCRRRVQHQQESIQYKSLQAISGEFILFPRTDSVLHLLWINIH
jgi:hypothetical protein